MKSWEEIEEEDRKWSTGEWTSVSPAPSSVQRDLDDRFVRNALAVLAVVLAAVLLWISWRYAK